ncbi:MAG: hypothetical protein AAGU21_02975 [Solidesulfovibrio sp.]|uniref:hypothetical protein n=1 Tax=Solidesulfovibrio sp. TaxID=2910990 RepID=UPI002B1F9F43|nr:hypothetical protein [Solidesulfovibrio sp.]MEA4856930.1 hypothetical protein [Solidesulfovibrio sp.]
MPDTLPAANRPRSTQPDFTPPTFDSPEVELAYYKDECRRLKAIIGLQKQKIRKLVAAGKA